MPSVASWRRSAPNAPDSLSSWPEAGSSSRRISGSLASDTVLRAHKAQQTISRRRVAWLTPTDQHGLGIEDTIELDEIVLDQAAAGFDDLDLDKGPALGDRDFSDLATNFIKAYVVLLVGIQRSLAG